MRNSGIPELMSWCALINENNTFDHKNDDEKSPVDAALNDETKGFVQ